MENNIVKLEWPYYATCPCGSIEYYIIVDKPDFSKILSLRCAGCELNFPVSLKKEEDTMWERVVIWLWKHRDKIIAAWKNRESFKLWRKTKCETCVYWEAPIHPEYAHYCRTGRVKPNKNCGFIKKLIRGEVMENLNSQIKEISMTLGHTKNMGNYESLRIDLEVKVQVMKDQSVSDTFIDMHDYLREEIQKRIDAEVAHIRSPKPIDPSPVNEHTSGGNTPYTKPSIKPTTRIRSR